MDNSKKNVHNSGPLGMLLRNGQINKLETSNEVSSNQTSSKTSSYFKTQSGIEFSEQELIYIDPAECEPWCYANRHENEMGDIQGLVDSIKANKQLQPALVRLHPTPHGKIKYEVIFGRRRHIACLQLGIPFLVIKKDIPNIQDAVASQDAENKLRNDVSNYSNALLYKRLLVDGVFKTEKELADKLNISTSTFNDLMAYSKIPDEIIDKIPNIHILSKQLAVSIVQILNKSKNNYKTMLSIAHQIGKTINSNAKLERIFESNSTKSQSSIHTRNSTDAKFYVSQKGKKLFTFKRDSRGLPSIVLNKEISELIDLESMCSHMFEYLEKELKSGYPD
ncbi:ParB/RepB/Spo0J family partition protein [Legionella pneumophila serogroup 1]|uniref:ParB/RepB/Spo0J family partition protein n=1 Tax=Fluoribacter dumoffii TaxID=463 RepID=UPI0022433AE6|nr:ParB/RepB/Spo0J family partition protein [Fluoribacter dumoffii]MCW8387913.1 ParB/RepB/Spo0J family partition protein [Fluoribacter dumoffii]HCX3367531.1 ParB/RepB/Spo0J family partition protein [Legionella pneumophila]